MNKSNSDKAAIAEQCILFQINMDKATEAFELFNKQGFLGNCSRRTAYDKNCDQIIVSWMIETDYNEEHALATRKAKQTVKYRNETFKNKNKLTSFELCVYLYITDSNKTNQQILAVYNAVYSEKKKQADIAKLIRISKGPNG